MRRAKIDMRARLGTAGIIICTDSFLREDTPPHPETQGAPTAPGSTNNWRGGRFGRHAKTQILKAKTTTVGCGTSGDMAYKLASGVAGENQMSPWDPERQRDLRMAKSLLDANWTRIIDRIRQLGVHYGRTVERSTGGIPAARFCSVCGLSQWPETARRRIWECPKCGTLLDRDWNAAVKHP